MHFPTNITQPEEEKNANAPHGAEHEQHSAFFEKNRRESGETTREMEKKWYTILSELMYQKRDSIDNLPSRIDAHSTGISANTRTANMPENQTHSQKQIAPQRETEVSIQNKIEEAINNATRDFNSVWIKKSNFMESFINHAHENFSPAKTSLMILAAGLELEDVAILLEKHGGTPADTKAVEEWKNNKSFEKIEPAPRSGWGCRIM